MRATSFIIGEATRKENVALNGTPASTKPKKRGTAEQEQKGVTMPSREARMLLTNLFLLDKKCRTFSGGKNERMIETI